MGGWIKHAFSRLIDFAPEGFPLESAACPDELRHSCTYSYRADYYLSQRPHKAFPFSKVNLKEIQIRDPFVLPDTQSRAYYLFGSTDKIYEAGLEPDSIFITVAIFRIGKRRFRHLTLP